MEKECLFCAIAEGKIETKFEYENDSVVVFRDINPHAPVHWLIVPKKHIRSINDITEADRPIIAEMTDVAGQMAKQAGVNKSGYKLLYNVESGGGQVIFHLHMHLLGGWEKKK
jgi:histidine triad (HIT) family protein